MVVIESEGTEKSGKDDERLCEGRSEGGREEGEGVGEI